MVPAGILANDVDAHNRGFDHAHALAADYGGAAMKFVSAPIWTRDAGLAGPRPFWMIALAVVSIALWQGVEHLVAKLPHPKVEQLHSAARLAKTAQAEIVR